MKFAKISGHTVLTLRCRWYLYSFIYFIYFFSIVTLQFQYSSAPVTPLNKENWALVRNKCHFMLMNNCYYYYAQNNNCRYPLEPPHLDGTQEHPKFVFVNVEKKNKAN